MCAPFVIFLTNFLHAHSTDRHRLHILFFPHCTHTYTHTHTHTHFLLYIFSCILKIIFFSQFLLPTFSRILDAVVQKLTNILRKGKIHHYLNDIISYTLHGAFESVPLFINFLIKKVKNYQIFIFIAHCSSKNPHKLLF